MCAGIYVSIAMTSIRAPKRKRTWGASEQKIVAARQGWKCAGCANLLPPSFQLDHITPLCDGGADCIETNAQCLCSNCHANKTQAENVARWHAQEEERRQKHELHCAQVRSARVEFERRVREEEEGRRRETVHPTGAITCSLCNRKFFPLWGHRKCPEVERRISERLGECIKAPRVHDGASATEAVAEPNPFLHFAFVASKC